jgi:hypothetical protein
MLRPVSAPVAQAQSFRSGNPTITRRGNVTTVTHTEFFFDLLGNNASVLPVFPTGQGYKQVINPLNPSMFPWLSTIAGSYEKYKFRKLEFSYSPIAPTTNAGSVILAIDYDVNDSNPISKQDLMAYQESIRCPVWGSCTHKCLSENLNRLNQYFCAYSIVTGPGTFENRSSRQNDVGMAYFCTVATSNGNQQGELYVSYTIDLITPQLNTPDLTRYTLVRDIVTPGVAFGNVFDENKYYLDSTIPLHVTAGTSDRLTVDTYVSKMFVAVKFTGNGSYSSNCIVNAFGAAVVNGTLINGGYDAGATWTNVWVGTISSPVNGQIQFVPPGITFGSAIESCTINIFPQGTLSFLEWGATFSPP